MLLKSASPINLATDVATDACACSLVDGLSPAGDADAILIVRPHSDCT